MAGQASHASPICAKRFVSETISGQGKQGFSDRTSYRTEQPARFSSTSRVTPPVDLLRPTVDLLNHFQPALPIDDIIRHAQNPRLLRHMEQFYGELDREIARHPGQCWMKTACCRFDKQNGHRLFVTFLDVCYYLARYTPPAASGETCPHLSSGICQVRSVRPLGCRVYYCDPAAQHWQESVAESFLLRLKKLHNELHVPYFYADWLHVLDAIRAHGGYELAKASPRV